MSFLFVLALNTNAQNNEIAFIRGTVSPQLVVDLDSNYYYYLYYIDKYGKLPKFFPYDYHIYHVRDTTKVDTTLKPMVSIFKESKSEQIQNQFDVNIVKMDTMNAKLDSIVTILKKRKK